VRRRSTVRPPELRRRHGAPLLRSERCGRLCNGMDLQHCVPVLWGDRHDRAGLQAAPLHPPAAVLRRRAHGLRNHREMRLLTGQRLPGHTSRKRGHGRSMPVGQRPGCLVRFCVMNVGGWVLVRRMPVCATARSSRHGVARPRSRRGRGAEASPREPCAPLQASARWHDPRSRACSLGR
jgi:hypothetical protein